MDIKSLGQRYCEIRGFTSRLVQELTPEDCMIQGMPDTSPTRWHLAHTTWFFETFVLAKQSGRKPYKLFRPEFTYLFNSYYNAVGSQFPRPERGFISRPGLTEILQYREYVDQAMRDLLFDEDLTDQIHSALPVIELGLHHEQQHQELILTDIKYAFSINPLLPAYSASPLAPSQASSLQWTDFPERLAAVGHAGNGFAFDNELPQHQVYLNGFRLANRPVTCGEYLEFIEADGYREPGHWLSLGWQAVEQHHWVAPLYWQKRDGVWMQFTLAGLLPICKDWPVCHVSYFEADAYARWAQSRLPTEQEWECAAALHPMSASAQWSDRLINAGQAIHPTSCTGPTRELCTRPTREQSISTSTTREGGSGATPPPHSLEHLFGGVWEWTSSSYAPYPGYRPPPGALGEYNGKFMCNQYVLRGGSVATPESHFRLTYRNFFPPDARWQFSGFRLARSIAQFL